MFMYILPVSPFPQFPTPPAVTTSVFDAAFQASGLEWMSFFALYVALPIAIMVALAITPQLIDWVTDMFTQKVYVGGQEYKKKDWDSMVSKKVLDYGTSKQASRVLSDEDDDD